MQHEQQHNIATNIYPRWLAHFLLAMQPARPACPPSCIALSSCRLIFRPWLPLLAPCTERRRRRQRQRSRKYCNAHCLSRMEQATGSQAHAAQWPAKRPLSPSVRPHARHVFSVQNWGVCMQPPTTWCNGRAQKINHRRGFCFHFTWLSNKLSQAGRQACQGEWLIFHDAFIQ